MTQCGPSKQALKRTDRCISTGALDARHGAQAQRRHVEAHGSGYVPKNDERGAVGSHRRGVRGSCPWRTTRSPEHATASGERRVQRRQWHGDAGRASHRVVYCVSVTQRVSLSRHAGTAASGAPPLNVARIPMRRPHPSQNALCQLLYPRPATSLPADRTGSMVCGALRLVFEILRRRSFDVAPARRDRDGPTRLDEHYCSALTSLCRGLQNRGLHMISPQTSR